jgi:hypothetical protein
MAPAAPSLTFKTKEVAGVMFELLWISAFYAAAAAFAHWLIRRGAGIERRQYVLIAGNHQMQIEWYIRALQQFSRRTGTEIGITVVLERSTDDTRRIMECFARGNERIEWVRQEVASGASIACESAVGEADRGNPRVVWVELSNQEDVRKLPL